MAFLHNAWYAAGWERELGESPRAVRLLGEHLVLFRGKDGVPTALADTCPHRFAPLSLGQVRDGRLVCGYHGLEFDVSGKCAHNPHGKGVAPAALAVRAYPVAEKYAMLWVWMGAGGEADPALIPDLPALEDAALSWVYGYLHVEANYELVVDNLLDLTHVEFLHPFLASPGNAARTRFSALQTGNRISALYDIIGEPVSGLFQLLFDGEGGVGDMHAHMHWNAPSNLYLDVGMTRAGHADEAAALIPSVHLLSPETEDTTLYFWAAGRNRKHDDTQISGMLHYGTQSAFQNEDEPMIRAVRSRMHSNDLFAHKPALLPTDEASIRARRRLKTMIDAEAAAAG